MRQYANERATSFGTQAPVRAERRIAFVRRPIAATLLLTAIGLLTASSSVAQTAGPKIPRVLPPPGVELPAGKRAELVDGLAALQKRLAAAARDPLLVDVELFAKAVDLALRFGEFYNEKDIAKDVAKATAALKVANDRLDQLAAGKHAWTEQRGPLVRGYRSRIDDSVQPYGLVIPEKLSLDRPVPLYVWLHGRGDKQTDLHFVHERQASAGQIAPADAIVLHAFGRQCLGFKSAGEIDVLEAIESVKSRYPIDPDRVVLIGFSMGGAGAWHLGAHYADQWVAVSPGAGFAETAQYLKIKGGTYPLPPWYEQALWGCYDVPAYARNLFNVPLFAYSGEDDAQIQAARVMETAFQEHGRTLRHLIGPKTGHKYHPDTLKELLALIDAAVKKGRDRQPASVSLQTQTLRYNRVHWVEATALEEHWKDARVDAERVGTGGVRATTRNVAGLRLSPTPAAGDVRLEIDGQTLTVPAAARAGDGATTLYKVDGRWTEVAPPPGLLVKKHGLQGPIDDAFLDSFLVVVPTGKSKRTQIQAWVDAELLHFQDRWRGVFRGEPRMKRDTEVTDDDIRRHHLVLWGEPESNLWIKKINGQLPVNWPNGSVQVEDQRVSAETHVPALIYPNPLNPSKYVVLNSGPTFREAHDKTNSQQNPKLPDWVVIDVTTPPDATSPGRIVNSGFFDERWQVRPGR